MRTINEQSAFSTRVYFDLDDQPVTPATIHYSLRCTTTNTDITQLTSLVTGESALISIAAASNNIINANNPYEVKAITVWTDYGLATQRTFEERYRVTNLGGVGDPVSDESDYN